jgi:Ca2+-binding RTX toxin-like protein
MGLRSGPSELPRRAWRRDPRSVRLMGLGGGIALAAAILFAASTATGAPAVDPCTQPPPPGSTDGATEGSDQILGTDGNDVIYGLGGNDDIKGGLGNDVICGGSGNDGLNAGKGQDTVGGGDGYDLIMGGDDADTIYGGANPSTIGDGLFGGNGNDTLVGNDDNGLGGAADYMIGGSGTDILQPGTNPTDQSYQDTQPNSEFDGDNECPSTSSAEIGVYGAPGRLDVTSPGPCLTLQGEVTADPLFANDGDKTFNMTVGGITYHVEFMPRDVPYFPGNGLDGGDTVRLRGLHVIDCHDDPSTCKHEIHPVYTFTFISGVPDSNPCRFPKVCISGPKYGGSPNSIRPGAPGAGNFRFCWNEVGLACSPWDPNGEAFH